MRRRKDHRVISLALSPPVRLILQRLQQIHDLHFGVLDRARNRRRKAWLLLQWRQARSLFLKPRLEMARAAAEHLTLYIEERVCRFFVHGLGIQGARALVLSICEAAS